jgi:hypothetical protein
MSSQIYEHEVLYLDPILGKEMGRVKRVAFAIPLVVSKTQKGDELAKL